jgi:uncharacterized integral membrane protein
MTSPELGDPPPPPPGGDRDWLRYVAIGAGVLIVLFALFNLDRVKVHWVVGSSRTPLIVVIVVSVALGGVAGYFLARRRYASDQKM